MSSVVSSVTPSSTACSNLYDTPIRDAVCAMPYSKSSIKHMKACCKDANVVSYYDDCGLYCLAVNQSVTDLTDCLYGDGAKWEDVFCRGNTSASATATGSGDVVESASVTVISKSDDKDDKDDKDKDDKKESSDDKDKEDKDGEDDKDNGANSGFSNGITTLVIGSLLFTTVFGGAFTL